MKNYGYEVVNKETSKDIPRRSWGYGLEERFEIIYKNKESLILFYKNREIATVEYGSCDDDDRIHFLRYGNFNILKAINEKVKELGWEV